ncbi:glycoside hydrolase family 3 N-terminal domain-containing protein [Aquirufa sp. LEPPI-3A]|uniref:glycoside hydrolase family 3 protein n=1 Tax=Aquirufa regiilacus TaxID=3024868 RepID=UPI0028DD77DB|nr:glycoside hydrolase family 3 N-terminal domain-containing protein [Aquirufa sp. LEPPI-3A]MDT8886172.1 glycoside hydrolase family 3 N-terminal domain-containing protein [Aquirufa sp. LEPPI-3A]
MKSRVLIALLFASSSLLAQTQPVLIAMKSPTLRVGKLSFKDLNKNNKLDKYEDWRLPVDVRVKDLVSQMTLEEKLGFMLISTTRMGGDQVFANGVQGGSPKTTITEGFNEEDLVQNTNMFTRKPLASPNMSAAGTTKGVTQFHLRHFILRASASPEIMAKWSNNLQELCESSRLGIPAIVASNPRNHVTTDASVGLSVGLTAFSKWPGELGLAAMRDFDLTRKFAETAAKEWRAVGLRKGYMYMADLATEPRWGRVEGTFGEDADLTSNMITQIVLGFQGNKLSNTSVTMTTKHFPGGGPQVDGQDSHFDWGKFAHYPGGMFDYHVKPFKAAIAAGTSAIMPYYSAPKGKEFEEVGFSFNKAMIGDLLQGKLGFQGIINSDTGPIEMMPWGVENLSIEERYQKALNAGVDIFSGAADPTTLIEVVKKGLIKEERINQSVAKLLKEKFDLGLFENPYVNVEEAVKTIGNAEAVASANLALRKSIVLLRNDEKRLPLAKNTKVYFETFFQSGRNAGEAIKVSKPNYPGLEFVNTKEEADVVLLWLVPTAGGLFSSQGSKIDLNLSKNRIDVNHVNEILHAKPTIVAINYSNPWVIEEIDKGKATSVIATFGTTQDALLDIVTGAYKPTGKMPFTTPISQAAVEANKSDVPGHMEGGGYGLFAFGHGLTY